MNARIVGWKLLCAVLAPTRTPESIRSLLPPGSDSERVWECAARWADLHLVTPAMWLWLLEKGLESSVPREPRRYLSSLYRLNRERNVRILRQLDTVLQVLNSRNIRPLLLKGASHIKSGVYADPGARILSDLDILVDDTDVRCAFEALEQSGYSAVDEWTNDRHCPPLRRPGEAAAIEIHWRHFRGKGDRMLPAPTLLDNSSVVQQRGVSFRLSPPTDIVLASFINSQILDGLGERYIIGLRPIQDLLAIRAAYGPNVDWKRILNVTRSHGAERKLHAYLYDALRVAGLETPSGIPIGVRARIHHRIALSRVRWKTFERLLRRLEGLSRVHLERQYGPAMGRVDVHRQRMRHAARAVHRRVTVLRNAARSS